MIYKDATSNLSIDHMAQIFDSQNAERQAIPTCCKLANSCLYLAEEATRGPRLQLLFGSP